MLAIASDASDVSAQKGVAETLRREFGGLDILFVNAGIADIKPVEQWDAAAFDRTFAINVKGPYFLVQALLPIFANPASIALNTSVNAHIGMPNTSVYGASKAALLSLARTLSGELISRGIRVNAVSPARFRRPYIASSACLKRISRRWRLPYRGRSRPAALDSPAKLLMRLSSWRPTSPPTRWGANS